MKEEKTLAQIASQYEVHLTQLKSWRAVALEGLPSLFEKQDSTMELRRAHEQQLTGAGGGAIGQSIVARHGGIMTVHSAGEGRGSSVPVVLKPGFTPPCCHQYSFSS